MVWDNVTSYCTANPFCWLLGDYARVPKGFQRRRNVPEPYFLLLLLFFLLKCWGKKTCLQRQRDCLCISQMEAANVQKYVVQQGEVNDVCGEGEEK